MEEQQTLSIPPGIVPSESKEDLYRKLCSEESEGNTNILKDVIINIACVTITTTCTDAAFPVNK